VLLRPARHATVSVHLPQSAPCRSPRGVLAAGGAAGAAQGAPLPSRCDRKLFVKKLSSTSCRAHPRGSPAARARPAPGGTRAPATCAAQPPAPWVPPMAKPGWPGSAGLPADMQRRMSAQNRLSRPGRNSSGQALRRAWCLLSACTRRTAQSVIGLGLNPATGPMGRPRPRPSHRAGARTPARSRRRALAARARSRRTGPPEYCTSPPAGRAAPAPPASARAARPRARPAGRG